MSTALHVNAASRRSHRDFRNAEAGNDAPERAANRCVAVIAISEMLRRV